MGFFPTCLEISAKSQAPQVLRRSFQTHPNRFLPWGRELSKESCLLSNCAVGPASRPSRGSLPLQTKRGCAPRTLFMGAGGSLEKGRTTPPGRRMSSCRSSPEGGPFECSGHAGTQKQESALQLKNSEVRGSPRQPGEGRAQERKPAARLLDQGWEGSRGSQAVGGEAKWA